MQSWSAVPAEPLSVWRWAAGRIARYRRLIVALLMPSASEVMCRVAGPWAVKAVMDYVFSGIAPPAWLQGLASAGFGWADASPRITLLLTIASAGFAVHVAHQLVMWVHTRLYSALGQLLTRDLRNDLFWHLQCLTLAHHTRNPPADALYRLSADSTCIEQLILRAGIPALSSIVTLVAMLIVLASINLWLAIVSLAVVPGLWMSLRLHSRRVAGEAARVKALESRAMEHAQESLLSSDS